MSALAVMTKSELCAQLKEQRRDFARILEALAKIEHRLDRFRKQVVKYTELVQVSRGTALTKAQEHLARVIRGVDCEERELVFMQGAHGDVSRSIQELEGRIATATAAAAAAAVPVEEKKEERVTSATLMVRLLSGDVKAVEIDMFRPAATFADEFAQQHGYSSSSTARMVFLIQSDEDEKEDTVFWSPEERNEGKTFVEVLGERLGSEDSEDLPMLNLFIRPMAQDGETESKVDLIRKLLKEKSLNDNYDDDELFTMFGTWHLTYQAPARGNRYLTMKAFVEQNGDVFWPLNAEDLQAQMERDAVRKFRSWAEKTAWDIATYTNLDRRIVALELLEGMIGRDDLESMKVNMLYFRHYIHPFELAHMGVPQLVMCGCEYEHCYLGHLAEWIARVGPITLPTYANVVWRI